MKGGVIASERTRSKISKKTKDGNGSTGPMDRSKDSRMRGQSNNSFNKQRSSTNAKS